MPRYYFDTECGGSRYEDPDGVELGSIDEARQQLAALLRDLAHHDAPEDVDLTVHACVRRDGLTVLRGSCSLAITRVPVSSSISTTDT